MFATIIKTEQYARTQTAAKDFVAKLNGQILPATSDVEKAAVWYREHADYLLFESESQFRSMYTEGIDANIALLEANEDFFMRLSKVDVKQIAEIYAPVLEHEIPLTGYDCLDNCGHQWDIAIAYANGGHDGAVEGAAGTAAGNWGMVGLLDAAVQLFTADLTLQQQYLNASIAFNSCVDGCS